MSSTVLYLAKAYRGKVFLKSVVQMSLINLAMCFAEYWNEMK